MNILVYCPMAPSTPKLYARTVSSIFNFDYEGPIQIMFGRNDTPTGTKYEDLCWKHNEARRLALAGGFDALFLVENDMVLPPDALTRLAAVDADVAYGLYVGRHGTNRWLAFKNIGELYGTSFSDEEELAKSAWNQVVRTQGVGMGCTLIHRQVLETVPFRTDPTEAVADDWLFSLDCIAHGFLQKHDFGVHCGHIGSDGNGYHILWPAIDSYTHVEIEVLGGYELSRFDNTHPLTVNADSLEIKSIWKREGTDETDCMCVPV